MTPVERKLNHEIKRVSRERTRKSERDIESDGRSFLLRLPFFEDERNGNAFLPTRGMEFVVDDNGWKISISTKSRSSTKPKNQ